MMQAIRETIGPWFKPRLPEPSSRWYCGTCRRAYRNKYHPCLRLYHRLGKVRWQNPDSPYGLSYPCIGPRPRWWEPLLRELDRWYFRARWMGWGGWSIGLEVYHDWPQRALAVQVRLPLFGFGWLREEMRS